MGKFFWWRLALVRIGGISLLIIMLICFGLNRNPTITGKLKKMVFPSATVTPLKWVLESRKSHALCGHTESKYNEYNLEEPFKTIIKTHYKQVKRINDRLYIYVEKIHDFCDSCRSHQFLGLKDHQIVVFRGTPEKPGPVIEKIPINLNKLPEGEIRDLQEGIPFRDGKEKLQLLEGLNGLSTE